MPSLHWIRAHPSPALGRRAFLEAGLSGVTFPAVEETEAWKIVAMGWCLVFVKGTPGKPRRGG